MIPIEKVQVQHDLKPSVCTSCQSGAFDSEVVSTEIRQVVELPETPPEVTQYNIHTCRCSCCGKHVKASIPPEAQYGFGPRLMGYVTSATCMDFLNRFDTLWLFVYTDGVEPTNNLAERGLRHGVIWRKLS